MATKINLERALKIAWEREVNDPTVSRKIDKLVRQFVPRGAGAGGRERTGSSYRPQNKRRK